MYIFEKMYISILNKKIKNLLINLNYKIFNILIWLNCLNFYLFFIVSFNSLNTIYFFSKQYITFKYIKYILFMTRLINFFMQYFFIDSTDTNLVLNAGEDHAPNLYNHRAYMQWLRMTRPVNARVANILRNNNMIPTWENIDPSEVIIVGFVGILVIAGIIAAYKYYQSRYLIEKSFESDLDIEEDDIE